MRMSRAVALLAIHLPRLAAGASIVVLACATTTAGAAVEPALQIFATTTTACGLGPGATDFQRSGPSGSFCNGLRVTGELYSEQFTFTGSASATALPVRGSFLLSATANGTMAFPLPAAINQGISASATGFMYFDLVEKSAAPFVADIPVFIRVVAGATVKGNAGAGWQVNLDGLTLVSRIINGIGEPGPHPFDETWSAEYSADSGVHSIFKAVSCGVIVAPGALSSADCTASLDPILSLNQAAFDARWGTDSFSLEDHYTIRVSANLVPVPEPQSWGLMLVGVALMGWRLRKAQH